MMNLRGRLRLAVLQLYNGSTSSPSISLLCNSNNPPNRNFSSKTPISKSNLATVQKPTTEVYPFGTFDSFQVNSQINLVSNNAIKEDLEDTTNTIATTEGPKKALATKKRFRVNRRRILRMEESELEGYAILQKKPPLIDRRGEGESYFMRHINDPLEKTNIDFFSVWHREWDFRIPTLKRWYNRRLVENDILEQSYDPRRNSVLGRDLAVAHFVVYRKGKVKFLDQPHWITDYRKDAEPGLEEEDLPVMRFDLCTLPIRFDPRYKLEAIDCTALPVRYEGLQNFENLGYVKWLSFKNCPFLDDWCLDRIVRIFHENLEFIDLSGCPKITDKGIGALVKCKNLNTLVLGNLDHIKHLEIVAALLEDSNSELTVIGIDYEKRREQLILEGEEIERKLLEEAKKAEENTITIEPPVAIGTPEKS